MKLCHCSILLLAFILPGCSSPDASLREAMTYSDPVAIKQAIDRGARLYEPVNVPPRDYYDELTPVSRVASNGDTELMKLLIDAGADPKRPDSYGWTPLHYAASKGNTRMIALLLEAGAECNTATLDVPKPFSRPVQGMNFAAGTTPLILATFFSSVESVEMLLKAKANGGHRDKQGRTALWQAELRIFQQSKTRLPDVEKIRRLLIGAGAKPHSQDISGLTARQTAATAWARP